MSEFALTQSQFRPRDFSYFTSNLFLNLFVVRRAEALEFYILYIDQQVNVQSTS